MISIFKSDPTVCVKKLRAVIKQVKQWGGELEASSDIGVGMRFIVRLKRAANA